MKIVVDDAVYDYRKIFAPFGKITALPGREIDKKTVRDADILIVRSRTKIDRKLLDESAVRFVGSAVSGCDHIDRNYLRKRGIKFANAKGANAEAVAEYVIAALFNLAADFDFALEGKTLGIIGVGAVGERVLKKAKMLGMRILPNDPPRAEKENLYDFVNLKTALGADILSFHTPLAENGKYPTRHLLGRQNFHLVKKNAIIINTARGGVIDENAWARHKTLANVIDCWENEPDIHPELRKNAYLATPHIAGHSIDAKLGGSRMIYRALCRFLKLPENMDFTLDVPKNRKIEGENCKEVVNQIYSFFDDDAAIRNIQNFESYRRDYPKRFGWRNFETFPKLPI